MELLRTPGLPTTRMPERGRQQAPDVVKCFGGDRPPSTDVCLHDAGAPDSLRHQTPVLLIHGANMNATSNWAAPPFTQQKGPEIGVHGKVFPGSWHTSITTIFMKAWG